MKYVAVLGSTGSIGTSCLDVIRHHADRLCVAGLTAHRSWQTLAEQAREFRPRWVALADAELQPEFAPLRTVAGSANGTGSSNGNGSSGGNGSSNGNGAAVTRSQASGDDRFAGAELLFGEEGIERIASAADVDVVIAGIVGAAGLRGTWAAVEAGKLVGLANKETMVVAGPLVNALAERSGATLVPVDSEHSAIYQALRCGNPSEVKRVVLTASGGPFRGRRKSELTEITPEQALAHPTWNMGRKITIDSATMMNKALEVIEAKWLFGLRDDQIGVVVHPQSVVHSFVEFVDGSVVAQLSPPDMRLPIQYALTWPDRVEGVSPKLDWQSAWQLTFAPPDLEAFPALALGLECAARGGSCGAVLNAANEVAVERFLAGEIGFLDIPGTCRAVLDAHNYDAAPSLTELFRLDAWARTEARRWRP